MDNNSDTEMSSIISMPNATPTDEVEIDAKVQLQPESLNERWAEVKSKLGSEIESVPLSGIVSSTMLAGTKFLENHYRFPLFYFKMRAKRA